MMKYVTLLLAIIAVSAHRDIRYYMTSEEIALYHIESEAMCRDIAALLSVMWAQHEPANAQEFTKRLNELHNLRKQLLEAGEIHRACNVVRDEIEMEISRMASRQRELEEQAEAFAGL